MSNRLLKKIILEELRKVLKEQTGVGKRAQDALDKMDKEAEMDREETPPPPSQQKKPNAPAPVPNKQAPQQPPAKVPAAPAKAGTTTTETFTNEDFKKAAPGQPSFSKEGEFIVAKVRSTNPQYSAYEGVGRQKFRGDQDFTRNAAAADAKTDLMRKIKQAK